MCKISVWAISELSCRFVYIYLKCLQCYFESFSTGYSIVCSKISIRISLDYSFYFGVAYVWRKSIFLFYVWKTFVCNFCVFRAVCLYNYFGDLCTCNSLVWFECAIRISLHYFLFCDVLYTFLVLVIFYIRKICIYSSS